MAKKVVIVGGVAGRATKAVISPCAWGCCKKVIEEGSDVYLEATFFTPNMFRACLLGCAPYLDCSPLLKPGVVVNR